MKRLCCTALVTAAVFPAIAADVGVSVSVGQPGFYGRIDLGNVMQPPQVIYPQPVLIQRVPVGVAPPPIYLRVPPGHEKHWRRHCHRYNACDRPVYFVQEQWYSNVYVPHYRDEHGQDRDGRREEERLGDKGRGKHKGGGGGSGRRGSRALSAASGSTWRNHRPSDESIVLSVA